MKRFAVDFVILPPAPIGDVAISLNKRLCNSNILLDRKNCLPHASLLMGCLRHEDLGRAESILKTIGSRHRVMQLRITGINTVGTGVGDVVALDIEPNEAIQSLHEDVVSEFAPLLTSDATKADVFGGPEVNDSTLGWINGFVKESSYDKFWPHITIGYLKGGAKPGDIDLHSFAASRIAICHLGNYCTCREILKVESLMS